MGFPGLWTAFTMDLHFIRGVKACLHGVTGVWSALSSITVTSSREGGLAGCYHGHDEDGNLLLLQTEKNDLFEITWSANDRDMAGPDYPWQLGVSTKPRRKFFTTFPGSTKLAFVIVHEVGFTFSLWLVWGLGFGEAVLFGAFYLGCTLAMC